MKGPLVSICCISYNQERFIQQTLIGFTTQRTEFTFEIVVSDDCSNDNTRQIIREYKKKYSSLIRDVSPDKNIGMLSNFWHVQTEAKGKYLAICEGDDYWTDPYKLQKQVDFMEKNLDFSMCFHGANLHIENGGKTVALCENVQTKEYFSDELKHDWIVPTASILCRRECVNGKIKHREWLIYGDIALVLQCAEHGRVMGFEDKMSVYRVNNSGVTQRLKYTLIQRIKHEKCLRLNFKKLSKQETGLFISKSYYSLAKNSTNPFFAVLYYISSFFYFPKYFFTKLRSFLTNI